MAYTYLFKYIQSYAKPLDMEMGVAGAEALVDIYI